MQLQAYRSAGWNRRLGDRNSMKPRKMLRLPSAVAALLLIFAPSLSLLFGQSAGTGALTGTVTDPSGASAPNVTVTLTSLETNQVRTTTTGTDGSYRFSLLPPGTYRVK